VLRIDGAFAAFAAKRQELIESNICPCEACESVERLRLKVILHAGPAVLHRIGRHPELAGADVILAHRLLKNSVDGDEYLLVTEAVSRSLGAVEREPLASTEERYDGFEPVRTFVYPPPKNAAVPTPEGHYATLWLKTRNILLKIFQGRLMQLRLLPRPTFRHLGAGAHQTGA
jgi:class 3 adenylate cyclase